MIGIICPVEAELEPYLQNMAVAGVFKKAMLSFYEGTLCGEKIAAVSCGVGRVNAAVAAQILIDTFKPGFIIVSGTAGGLYKGLDIGDTVISEDAVYHDLAPGMLTDYHPRMSSVFMRAGAGLIAGFKKALAGAALPQKTVFGRIATGETFIEREGRAAIVEKYSPLCVDMETAGIAHVCYLSEIPFIAVRSVSDTEEKSGLGTFRENCALAARNSYRAVERFLYSLHNE